MDSLLSLPTSAIISTQFCGRKVFPFPRIFDFNLCKHHQPTEWVLVHRRRCDSVVDVYLMRLRDSEGRKDLTIDKIDIFATEPTHICSDGVSFRQSLVMRLDKIHIGPVVFGVDVNTFYLLTWFAPNIWIDARRHASHRIEERQDTEREKGIRI